MARYIRLHWATKITILVVLVAIQVWQCRLMKGFASPMYGWPAAFNNVWLPRGGQWRPFILLFDAGVWLIIAMGAGLAVERWQRKGRPWRYTLGGSLFFVSVSAFVMAMYSIEQQLRVPPDSPSSHPRRAMWQLPEYGHAEWGDTDVAFDIGLFTAPVDYWPLTRIVIILALFGAAYTAGWLLYAVTRNVVTVVRSTVRWSMSLPAPETKRSGIVSFIPKDADLGQLPADPLLARVAIWTLIMILVYLLWRLLPPQIT